MSSPSILVLFFYNRTSNLLDRVMAAYHRQRPHINTKALIPKRA